MENFFEVLKLLA